MLTAKNFIFVETLFPQTSRLCFVTDINPEKTYCKANDFYEALKQVYKFRIDEAKDVKIKLNMGSSLIIDLERKIVFNFDEMDRVLLNKGIVRQNKSINNDQDSLNRYVEMLVSKNFFKR